MSKREEYQKKLENQLSELSAEIAKLKEKAEKAGSEFKKDFGGHLEQIKDKQADARQKLEELRETSGEAWEELREGLDKSWESLSTAIKNAAARFK